MSKPAPWRSTTVLIAAGVLLLTASSVYQSHCAFGFGGFQCNGLPSGSGSLLVGATISLLALSAVVAVWVAIGWVRWLLSVRRRP